MGRLIPEEKIDEILERIDIIDVISDYVRLKKQGKNYMGLCPFHSEKTPSFSVSPEKKLFYCFGCGTGGNVINFLMKIENYTFVEAIETLAKREGIQLSITNKDKKYTINKAIYDVNALAQKFYSYILWNHKGAAPCRKYLRERGIDEGTARKFGLGYAPKAWRGLYNFLEKRGVKEETAVKAGLIVKKDNDVVYDRFRHRLLFPIYDLRGRIVGFGGRQISAEERGPKYLNSPETEIFHKGKTLYGLNFGLDEIRKKNQALVVEGYMDVIACHQFGITNTVASLGTSFSDDHAKLLKRNCDEVVIAYDADTAGTEATLRGLQILNEAGCRVKVLSLPEGSDPDDFIRNYGRESFFNALENKVLSLIDYKLKIALKKYRVDLPEGKAKALEFLLRDLLLIQNAVERQHYVQKIAFELKIREDAIYEEISRWRKMQKFGTRQDKKVDIRHNTKEGKKLQNKGISEPEKFLLKRMLEDTTVFKSVKEELGFECFHNDIKEILLVAEEIIEKFNGREITPLLLNKLDEQNTSFLSSIVTMEEKIQVSLEECIKSIKLKYWHRQEKELLKELKEAEEKGDNAAVSTLVRSINELQKEIQRLKNK